MVLVMVRLTLLPLPTSSRSFLFYTFMFFTLIPSLHLFILHIHPFLTFLPTLHFQSLHSLIIYTYSFFRLIISLHSFPLYTSSLYTTFPPLHSSLFTPFSSSHPICPLQEYTQTFSLHSLLYSLSSFTL